MWPIWWGGPSLLRFSTASLMTNIFGSTLSPQWWSRSSCHHNQKRGPSCMLQNHLHMRWCPCPVAPDVPPMVRILTSEIIWPEPSRTCTINTLLLSQNAKTPQLKLMSCNADLPIWHAQVQRAYILHLYPHSCYIHGTHTTYTHTTHNTAHSFVLFVHYSHVHRVFPAPADNYTPFGLDSIAHHWTQRVSWGIIDPWGNDNGGTV